MGLGTLLGVPSGVPANNPSELLRVSFFVKVIALEEIIP
jgi:hypothetical protein